MKASSPTPAGTAEALAANFQVSELEPRLENAWGTSDDEKEMEVAQM